MTVHPKPPHPTSAHPTSDRPASDRPASRPAQGPGTIPLFEVAGLSRSYPLPHAGWRAGGRPGGRRARRQAVRDVTLTLPAGSSLGIVGESGSGKSTLVRLLLGLDRPDSGTIRYRGRPVRASHRSRDLRWLRRDVQVVLQDPVASLDPRLTVGAIVAEPLECLRIDEDHGARVEEVLAAVGLPADARDRFPHAFSGGQRQRIAIARALAPRPRVLVGDEPVSALDMSVRAQILDLLGELTAAHRLGLILVSHDLGVVARLCDQAAVMRAGEIVERGPTAALLTHPTHPYTRALLDAVPRLPIG
ncbi:putative cell wall oligopeptide ABC transporter (ATP binding protein) [Frankia canadensis]|uniref:Putative cell wall oligopeptide ABC transporter (ATP binding protein) n=1 Tax=Frankia canadensis TaxID=1836972 RepID=A0A2I2KQ61_9ACTN|nr:putative cell wall oligopeptide ABC transporter (ATP binding protein) [Frankia canadensis]SOU55092.1 putative cell wall oligopeptide ABC transporter (ATP binding protein) [Frankia canadensis]